MQDTEFKKIKHFRHLLEAFRDMERKNGTQFSLEMMISFVMIAENPGIYMSTIRHALDIPSSSASRYYDTLSERGFKRNKGFGLVVSKTDTESRTQKALYLTLKGKAFVHKLLERGGYGS